MARRNGIRAVPARVMVSRDVQGEVFAFQPLPVAPGKVPYRLSSIALDVPPSGVGSRSRVFHVVGDDGGIADPSSQKSVVAAMVEDLKMHPAVGWCWHVGDWAYYNGGRQEWLAQVLEPRVRYGRVVVGIPGNHDGDPEGDGESSLAAFVRYQCDQEAPRLLPEMVEYQRDTVQQPNVYWTLQDDACTIIGLYTNVPEGGQVEVDQESWFRGELNAAPTDRPLIVSLHHPLFSVDAHHGGSARMVEMMERCFGITGRYADLIMSGHVHDYQRFEWTLNGHVIPCLVVGASGYHNLHAFADDVVPGMTVTPAVRFMVGNDQEWGFLRLSIQSQDGVHNLITGEYVGVAKDGTVTPAVDRFNYNFERR